jgi:dolichol-phosphate mannosyltransferase
MFLRGLVAWTGHKSKSIEYIEDKRIWGTSKYTFANMLKLAIDAITSFSTFPLRIASIVGIFMAMTSGLYGLYVVVTWIYNREVILGWSSVILSVLFIGGIQLVILGIVGEYIGKIFLETKRRPLYLIGETNI